jgi:hypothetical protein
MHLDVKSIFAGSGSVILTAFGIATLQQWALICGIIASLSTVVYNIYKFRKDIKK